MLLFADDTKIFNHIATRVDALTLQFDIDSIESWSRKWLLIFHPDKCHVLTTGKFENIRHTHRYSVYDKELEQINEKLNEVLEQNKTFTDAVKTVHTGNSAHW